MEDIREQMRNISKSCNCVYILETSASLRVQFYIQYKCTSPPIKHLPSLVKVSILDMLIGYLNNKSEVLTNRMLNDNLLVGKDICF